MKRILFIASLIFVFSTAFVFADDETSVSANDSVLATGSSAEAVVLPSSALLATVTDENEIALDNELRTLSASLASTSDSGYTSSDIYTLLISFRTVVNGSNTFRVYDSQALSKLADIETSLNGYLPYLSQLSTISGYLDTDSSFTMGALMVDLCQHLGVLSGTDGTIYNNISAIKGLLKDSTNSISIGDSLASISESNAYIYNRLADIRTDIGLFRSDFETYFSNLTRVLNNGFDDVVDAVNVFADDNHSDLTAIDSSVDDFASANHTDLTSIDTSISDFNDDFNSVDWASVNFTFYGLYDSDNNQISSSFDSTLSANSDYYLLFDFRPTSYIDLKYLKFNLPFYSVNVGSNNLSLLTDFNIYNVFGSNQFLLPNFSYQLYPSSVNSFILYSDLISYPIDTVFRAKLCFSTKNNYYSTQLRYDSSRFNISYLDSSMSDFYLYDNFRHNHISEDILDKFEYLYASDDLIQAKQEQQSYETQAIDDFTGGGSASASVSNLTDAKSISNTLKTGLDAGGSASNALAVFDSANAFWGWFSNDCASYFTVSIPSDASPSPVLRSRNVNEWDNIIWTDNIPDVVTSIDIQYERGLGN